VSEVRLVTGVLGLDIALAAVGYAVLAPSLRGRLLLSWLSYWGVALLVGTGLIAAILALLAIGGVRTGPLAFAAVAVSLASAGIVVARFGGERLRTALAPPAPKVPAPSRAGALLATVGAFGVVAICFMALIGGFRAAAWLDDTWFFWLPKGRTLELMGLDPRVFAPSDTYFEWTNPYYPLAYPILINLEMRSVGSLDFRALSAHDSILMIALVAAVARLAWGHVRPAVLWAALLPLVASPGIFRQAQDGGADVPLACFVAAFMLAALGWLVTRRPFFLLLTVPFALAAVSIKREGLPQLLILLAVLSVFSVWRAARRTVSLWAVAGLAVASTIPWSLWRRDHGVENEFVASDALSRSYLLDRMDQFHTAADSMAFWAFNLSEWLPVLELATGLALLGLILERRLYWLAVPLMLTAVYWFWIWVYWGYPQNLLALQPTAYRTTITLIVVASVLLPLLSERVLAVLPLRRGLARKREAELVPASPRT
jgi:hypothetical protein